MFAIDEAKFNEMVGVAIDNIPKKYARNIKNVAFFVEDDPTLEQRQELKLRNHQTLFGLYEGIPLTRRASGYNLVLPDKITLFKNPLSWASHDEDSLQLLINKTVWHEVAHYFGLDHAQIYKLEAPH